MRQLISSKDVNEQFLVRIFSRADQFAKGGRNGYEGSCLGFMFLSESTRTSSTLKSAITKLRGGWLGLEGIKGTYLQSQEDDLQDTIVSIADFCDVLAVRGKIDEVVLRGLRIPVINALINDDHLLAAVWNLYSLWRRFNRIRGLRVGAYGMIKYSSPIKSIYSLLGEFGVHIFEDSVITELSSPMEIRETIKARGSVIEQRSLHDFSNSVDILYVAEGIPGQGANAELVARFLKEYKQIDESAIAPLPQKSYWSYMSPRKTTDGRLTVARSLDNHPLLIKREYMSESVYCNMGILAELIDSARNEK